MKKMGLITLVLSVLLCTELIIAQEKTTNKDKVVVEEEVVQLETPPTEEREAPSTGGIFIGIYRFYKEGGGFMHAILLLALIALGIAIERAYKLWLMQKFNTKEFFSKLKGYLINEKYDEAVNICQVFRKTTMASIFLYGIKGFIKAKEFGKKGEELNRALQQSFDEAALNELPELEKRLHYLDTFAQMATLLGLLGTIFGLIVSFSALGNLPPEARNAALTAGIAIAMHTTAFGLIVALPIMLVKAILQSKASNIINEIDEYCVKAINTISANI